MWGPHKILISDLTPKWYFFFLLGNEANRLSLWFLQRRQWHSTPVLLPGKSHGWRSPVGCGPWGHTESDTTERLHFHFSFSCIGEENGNPLQCSCLENPRDGGAWWAAVYGVAWSQTWLRDFTFTFHFHALEKEMATHSSVLAWRIPGMGEPGGLPSMGSHRVRHNWSDLAAAAVSGVRQSDSVTRILIPLPVCVRVFPKR